MASIPPTSERTASVTRKSLRKGALRQQFLAHCAYAGRGESVERVAMPVASARARRVRAIILRITRAPKNTLAT
jgi:hypothetical protein